MELSEVIRLGALLSPQVRNVLYTIDPNGEISGTCVVGAAMHAVGVLATGVRLKANNYILPFHIMGMITYCPVDGCQLSDGAYRYRSQIATIMVHLNDAHRWPREMIADWVEQIELAQTTTETVLLSHDSELEECLV